MPVRIPLDALLAEDGGVIVVRRHPEHRRSLYRLVETGTLTTVLPGVLAFAGSCDRSEVRLRALALWDPDVVVTRAAAARLTFWPEIEVPVITGALPRHRTVPSGFELVQEAIPPQLIRTVGGVRVTEPGLTALDLALTDRGAAIERVLRTRLVSIAHLDEVLESMPRRRDNAGRRRWLNRSRRRPWSAAERILHDLLRAARIDGWLGNCAVRAGGVRYVVDIVFRDGRVVIEVDGYEFHRVERQEQFHRDRRKWTDLATAGWTVLHFHLAAVDRGPRLGRRVDPPSPHAESGPPGGVIVNVTNRKSNAPSATKSASARRCVSDLCQSGPATAANLLRGRAARPAAG